MDSGPQAEQAAASTAPHAAPAAPAAPAASQGAPADFGPPSFDVVRIDPKGDAVMAGRARLGSTVVIMDGDKIIGRVTADDRGEWVFVPEKPLEAGSRRLSLETRSEGREPEKSASDVVLVVPEKPLEAGSRRLSLETRSEGREPEKSASDVVLVVPEKGKDIAGRETTEEAQALVLKVPRTGGGASTVLQRPKAAGEIPGLFVDSVDYDDQGRLNISGRAAPGARVRLYLDGRFIGRAEGDGDGRWSLTPDSAVAPGLYTLRADSVDARGRVLARVSTPFSRAQPLAGMRPGSFLVVQPGNSLWRLARRTYGSGFSYTVIFDANKDQIGDPDLIFPGQVFALPKAAGGRGVRGEIFTTDCCDSLFLRGGPSGLLDV